MNKKGWDPWRLTTNGKPLVLPQSGRRNSVTRLHGRAQARKEGHPVRDRVKNGHMVVPNSPTTKDFPQIKLQKI